MLRCILVSHSIEDEDEDAHQDGEVVKSPLNMGKKHAKEVFKTLKKKQKRIQKVGRKFFGLERKSKRDAGVSVCITRQVSEAGSASLVFTHEQSSTASTSQMITSRGLRLSKLVPNIAI